MEDAAASTGAQQLEDFIEKWSQSSGAERANFQSFANELCDLLDVSRPDAAKRDANDSYVFEYGVKFKSADGAESPGWVDLYKRGCFVSKRSRVVKRDAPRQFRANKISSPHPRENLTIGVGVEPGTC
ncbi:MAG: hypothetical protein A49_03410 [Methyloceanibacter sp.]|nr:MAG: hypothetical protein A49_03410 [Methyloceanibacter sp.]